MPGRRVFLTRARVYVTQATNNAVIDWSSFNIGSGEAVQFFQPSASSIALNRIHDARPSAIDGSLTANGQVWLVNPNGIMFGRDAQVNVGGLLATTSDIDNGLFMSGDYTFTHPGNPLASIFNSGHIQIADGGIAALVGPNVTNDGLIEARLGKVQLGSGDTFTLDLYGDGLINLAASPSITSQLVSNSGSILADGGSVLLTAAAAGNVVNSLIDMSGIIQANSVGNLDGHITLYAEGSNAVPDNVVADKGLKQGESMVQVSGTINAIGQNAGETGGFIAALADWVGIKSGATLNASGDSGGGTINVGGDFHGQGTTPTASTTVVEGSTNLYANATSFGKGGNIAVWSDNSISFSGNIEAKGGPNGGDGGFVETSGHELMGVGTVNAGAPHGNAGTWLIDPTNILIDQTTCTGAGCFSANSIGTSLGTTNVTITTTTGSITLDNSTTITDSGSANTTLDFEAGTDIVMNNGSAITASGTGKLNVTFDADTALGGGAVFVNGNITTGGGNIIMGGQGSPATMAAVGDSSWTDAIEIEGALNAGSGNITLNGQGYGAGNGGYGADGVLIYGGAIVEVTGPRNIAITGTGGGTSNNTNNYGVYVEQGGIVESTGTNGGTITITGTGGDAGGSGDLNIGVQLGTWGGSNGNITSVNGNISVTGHSGTSTGNNNGGIAINGSSTVSGTGNASVTLTGTGNGTGGLDYGVYIGDSSGTPTISVKNGNLSITGNGSTTDNGGNNYGVQLDTGTLVKTTGTGNITIQGTGGGTGTGGSNYGVYLSGGGVITGNSTGTITVTGIDGSGSGGSNYGFYTDGTSGNMIGTSGGTTTGDITLQINDYSISKLAINTTGTVTFEPYTANTTVGVNNAGSTLNIQTGADQFLNDIGGASLVVVGDTADTAQLTAAATTWTHNAQLITGSGTLDVSGAQTMNGHNLTIQTDGLLSIGANLTPSSGTPTLTFLPSTTTDTIAVNGTGSVLNITNADLGYIPSGWGNIVVGTSADSGTMSVSNYAWNTALTLNSGSGNVNIVNGSGNLGFINPLTINTTTGNVLMQATTDISESGGGTITTQGGNIVLDSNSGGGTSGAISLGSNILNSNGGTIDLGGGSLTSGLTTGSAYGDGSYASGIYLNGTTLNAGSGNLTLAGHGYSSGASSGYYGVDINASTVETTGAGSLTVQGTGGGSGTSSANYGVYLSGTGVITATSSGNISVTGIDGSGSGGSNYGFYTDSTAGNKIGTGSGTTTGNITLITNDLSINTLAVNTTGNITIAPYASGGTVGVGSGSGNLSVTNAILGDLSGYSTLTIGSTTAGAMDINTSTSFSKPLSFITGGGSTPDITLDGQITDSVSGAVTPAAIVVASGRNNINNYGSTVFNLTGASSPRWLLYSANPANDTKGGLTGYTKRYDKTYAGYAPSSVTETGDVWLYSIAPVITVTANNASKTYGAANPSFSASYSGFIDGDTSGPALTGSPSLTTTATASSNVGTYTITSAAGSLASAMGYTFNYVNGTLTVTTAPLTVTASNQNKTYGFGGTSAALGTTAFTVSGLQGTDAIDTATLATNATLSGSLNYNAGTWTLTPSAAHFSSGTSGNYSITYDNASVGLTIATKALSITGLSGTNKVYDSLTSDPITGSATLSGNISGDTVNLANGSAAFADPNVGTGKAVTFSGYSISGSDAANYALSQPASSTANITAAGLTVTASNQNKTYGFGGTSAALGTTAFTVSGLQGTDAIDTATLATNATLSGSLNYNAGTWTLTPSAAHFSSGTSGNYSITYDNASVGLTIATKALSITGLSGTNKVYDSLTSDPITGSATLSGNISGDTVNLANGRAAFADPNVGTGKAVTFSGYSISSSDAANYSLSQPATSSANITAASLTITASNQDKTYGFGGTSAALGTTAFTVSGLQGSDAIDTATLSTNATLSGSLNYNAGTWTLTPSAAHFSSGLGSNYSIIYDNAAVGLTIAQKALAITGLSGTNKVYDSLTSDPITGSAALSGNISGDTVNLSAGSASFADPNVGTGKTVNFSGYSISSSDAANYSLSQPATSSANISAASLTITASNQDKTYGFGGTSAALGTTAFTVSGLQGSDAIDTATLSTNATLSGSLNYNAGTWTLTPSAAHFSSGLGSNYSITYDNASTGLTIAAKVLSITGLSGTDKVYDSTTADPITGSASLSGNISGDVVNLANGTAVFGDPNVGTGKTVTFSGYSISGADAADYSLSQPASSTANIIAAGLTVTADNKASTYAQAIPPLTATITGFVGGQSLGTSGVTGSAGLSTNATSGSNAGNYVITAALGSLSAGNYDFTTFNNGTLTINAAGSPHSSGPGPIPSSFFNQDIVIADGILPILCMGGSQSRHGTACDVASRQYLSRPRTFANKDSLAGNAEYGSNGDWRGDASDLSSSTGDDRNPGF